MTNNNALMISPNEYNTITQMAETLLRSGYLPRSINNGAQAVAIILAGRELGIQPWQAVSTINVIQGKPTISPQLMLALIESSGKLEDIKIDGDDKQCTVTMKRVGRTPHTETFTFQDAQALGLTGKDNYKKQPKVMLRWRAVAACARVVFPDVILGLYTPEELGADVVTDEQGEMQVVESQVSVSREPNGNGRSQSSSEKFDEMFPPPQAQPAKEVAEVHPLADKEKLAALRQILADGGVPDADFLKVAVEGRKCERWSHLPKDYDWILNRAREVVSTVATPKTIEDAIDAEFAEVDGEPAAQGVEEGELAAFRKDIDALFPTMDEASILNDLSIKEFVAPVSAMYALVMDVANEKQYPVVATKISYHRGKSAEETYLTFDTPVGNIAIYNPYATIKGLFINDEVDTNVFLETNKFDTWRKLGDKTLDIDPVVVYWNVKHTQDEAIPTANALQVLPLR